MLSLHASLKPSRGNRHWHGTQGIENTVNCGVTIKQELLKQSMGSNIYC